jgi:group I intron endonuclease
MKSGIYKILNIINTKIYIGSSENIPKRWKRHLKGLKENNHYNNYLQRAFNMYKEENFKFEVIETCPIENLIEREQCWMDYFQSYNPKYGYNLSPTAGSQLGYKFNPEDLYWKGKHLTEEHKRKVSEGNKGKKLSEEHINILIKAHTGKPLSKEHKQKLSEANKGQIPWIKGRKQTEEHRRKISESNKGQKRSEEARHNMSIAHMGKVSRPKGFKHSEEAKQNMRKPKSRKNKE